MEFNQLNLKPELLRAIEKEGYTNPTEIQAKSIPVIFDNKDLLGKSHTGTGKTAAFLLPILSNLQLEFKRPQAIILCPTRELAIQVLNQIRKFSQFLQGVNATLICGGSNMANQIYGLKKCNIVVGTPGRVIDHLNRRTLRLNNIKTIVLDEADEMLKMGFKKDIDQVFSNIPNEHQTLLFSATMPKGVLEIVDKYQKEPVQIKISHQDREQNNIKQYYVNAQGYNKTDAFINLIKATNPQLSIIFANTKIMTNQLSKLLLEQGIKNTVINGDKTQGERVRAMREFRAGNVKVLIATDVAARGIDVEGIDYVYNYDLPLEQEVYTHRIGRTARAGAEGVAISIISTRKDFLHLKSIEKYQRKETELYNLDLSMLPQEKSHNSNRSSNRGWHSNFKKSAPGNWKSGGKSGKSNKKFR
ncbi:DEAD-box ATP-dependent RNA helicase [Spiroplasma syrphidicola EA-1]|uniref:DEAD-box ATP-dependent RNA helicase n=1 Tax=Spiroplasma syrphidicola EA-1 TaxID=1276229 RepID=R4UKJ2_9MOLU|nr:DEAD/DEAH box helicase [Spiroplasma syrphidicola]AGM25791.1 DEAD-box ATP-dependent RNA helicase [Spiroplasma syrphidicola EA-1]